MRLNRPSRSITRRNLCGTSNAERLPPLKRVGFVHSSAGSGACPFVEEEVEEEEEAASVEEEVAVTEVALIVVDEVALDAEVDEEADEEASTEADLTRGLQKGSFVSYVKRLC